jgi:hypothetical protein
MIVEQKEDYFKQKRSQKLNYLMKIQQDLKKTRDEVQKPSHILNEAKNY